MAQTTGSHNFMGEIDGSGYIFECGWISRSGRVLDNLLQIRPQLRESNGRHRDKAVTKYKLMLSGILCGKVGNVSFPTFPHTTNRSGADAPVPGSGVRVVKLDAWEGDSELGRHRLVHLEVTDLIQNGIQLQR